jgi:hypothetical protein
MAKVKQPTNPSHEALLQKVKELGTSAKRKKKAKACGYATITKQSSSR